MKEAENRYRKALSARVREEEAAQKKQETLRETYGISGEVLVTEKKTGSRILSAVFFLAKVLMAVLSFLFVLVLLDPEMRRMFFEMPFFGIFTGMK